MRTALIKQDIQDNIDKLPAVFQSGAFYHKSTQCRCLFGWLSVVTGGPDPVDQYADVSEYIKERYLEPADDCTYLTITSPADQAIMDMALSGDPRGTRYPVADAQLVVDVYLAGLEADAA
jgi:hypothetical protein